MDYLDIAIGWAKTNPVPAGVILAVVVLVILYIAAIIVSSRRNRSSVSERNIGAGRPTEEKRETVRPGKIDTGKLKKRADGTVVADQAFFDAKQAFFATWSDKGYMALRSYSEKYKIIPTIWRGIPVQGSPQGTLINKNDTVAPEEALGILVYLDFQYTPPNPLNGEFIVTHNGKTILTINSIFGLAEPFFHKVSPGDQVSMLYRNNSGDRINLCCLQLAWCLDINSDYLGRSFNYIPVNPILKSLDEEILRKRLLCVGIIIDISAIRTTPSFPKIKTPLLRRMHLFSGTVPEGYTTLMSFADSDNESFDLRDHGMQLFVYKNGSLLDIYSDNVRDRRLYQFKAGDSIDFMLTFTQTASVPCNQILFALLPDRIPESEKDGLEKYISNHIKFERMEEQIENMHRKIEDLEERLEQYGLSETECYQLENEVDSNKKALAGMERMRIEEPLLENYVDSNLVNRTLVNNAGQYSFEILGHT